MATQYKTIRVSNGKPPKGAQYVSPGVYRVPVKAGSTTSGGSSSGGATTTKPKTKKSGGSSSIPRDSDPDTIAVDEEHARNEAIRFFSTGALGRVDTPEKLAQVAASGKIGMINPAIDARTQQSISQAEAAYNNALQTNPYVEAALQAGQESLAGFSGPEYQAMLERANRGINSSQATTMRALRQSQGANGVNGGVGAYMALRDANKQRQQATSDVLAQAAQDRTQRIANFGNMANTAYTNYAGVRSDALGQLMGAREYGTNYTKDIMLANQGAEGTNISNENAVNTKNAEIGKYNIDNVYASALENLNRQEREISGQSESYYGDLATSIARRNQDRQNQIANQAVKNSKRGY